MWRFNLSVLLITSCQCFVNCTTPAPVTQCGSCQNLQSGLPYTEGMIKGRSEISGTTTCNKTVTCFSPGNYSDAIISITVEFLNGNKAEAAFGSTTIKLNMFCNNGSWFMAGYDIPLKNVFYCEVTPEEISQSTTAITSTTSLSPPILPQCGSCQNLQSGLPYTEGMIKGRSEISGTTTCNKTVTCFSPGNYSNSIVSITVEFLNGNKAEAGFGNTTIKLNMYCNTSSWFMAGYDIPLKNVFYCEVTPTHNLSDSSTTMTTSTAMISSTLTNIIPSSSTTSVKPEITFSSTSSSSSRSTNPTQMTTPIFDGCNKSGFQQLSASADPKLLKSDGKLGGFFKSRSLCQELCYLNYGLLTCNGYMYEPNNRGECTIFQYSFNEKINEKPNSNVSVFEKCTTTPSISTDFKTTTVQTTKITTSTFTPSTTTTTPSTTSASTSSTTFTQPTTTTKTSTTTSTPPTTTTTPSTTSASTNNSSNCCNALIQHHSLSIFADGLVTFTYNNNQCRSTATVICKQPEIQGLELYAAIVVNRINYVEVGSEKITFPATCRHGKWQMGYPPLNVETLECQLTDPV